MTSPVAGFETGIPVSLGASVTGLACIADASLSLPSFRPAREDVGVGSTAVLSDIHLASSGGIDLLRRPEFRERLWAELEGADEVVLLGDVVELRDMPLAAAVEIARPFFDELGAVVGDGRVVMVPGNHDHHLLDEWLERRRLDDAAPLGLEQRIPIDAGPLAELTRRHGQDRGGARVPRRVPPAERLRHPRPLPGPPPHRPELRAPRGRRGRARPHRLAGPVRRRAPCPWRPGIGVTGRLRAHPGAAVRVPVHPRAERRLAEGPAGRGKPVGPRVAGGRRRATGGRLAYAAGCLAPLRYPERWGSRIGWDSGP